MLGSLITRPIRIATRSVTIPYRLTRGAIDVAEGVAGLVLLRLRQHDNSSPGAGRSSAEPSAWRPPAPNTMEQEPEAPPAPRRTAPAPRRPSTNGHAAPTAPRPPRRPRRAASEPASTPVPEPPASPTPGPPPAPAPQAAPTPPAAPAPAAPAPPTPGPAAAPAPALAEPAHVAAEVELVEESADPGATDGAGAQIRIDEPWEGYRQMKAADIVDRLTSASREEIAAVELFETVGRKRKSVLTAAERALRQKTPPQG
jgi:hypothetical protein